MSITPGSKLGPYEILSPLGAGGMGEVWRARDARLDRDVAIKVLPADVASDPSRLKRFEREARSASALNHPNIVTIYDTGQTEGLSWIAMEKVDGRTLRELMAAGPLPAKRTLAIGAQIADGLAKAHEAGIVHRDLKPENVMVTKDGLVKILDFGLAKVGTVGSGSGEVSQLPTQTGTSPGVVLGTVGYMSPEQASGHPVDFRSDQFALGSILYEMAAGKRAFQKKTAVDTLSAILNEEPEPMAAASPQAPAPLRWIVERCLAKDPEGRYASSTDLARDLASVRDHISETLPSGATPMAAPFRRLSRIGAAAALAVVLAAGLAAGRWLWTKTPSPPSFRRLTFRSGRVMTARFAPDGQTVVYTARWGTEPPTIFSMRPGSVESRALGEPGASVLSISPSGEMLILRGGTGGVLARVSLAGGGEREVLDGAIDAAWGPNGSDIAVMRRPAGSQAGMTGARLEFPIGKVLCETTYPIDSPSVSPRGDVVAFVEHPLRGNFGGDIAVVDLKGKRRRLTENFADIANAAWSPRGDEIWFSANAANEGGAIYAVNLAGKLRIVYKGPGNQVVEDVSPNGRVLVSNWTSRNVLQAFGPGDTGERELSWLDGSRPFALSDDGRTLLFTEIGEGAGSLTNSVWKRQTDGSAAVRLGEGMGIGLSPDGKWVLAVRLHPRPAQLVLIPTGPGEEKILTHDEINHRTGAWFPDGQRVLFVGDEPEKGPRLYVQDIAGGQPRPISAEATKGTIWMTWRPVSPDGRRVVFFDGQYFLYPVEGGQPQPIPGLERGELVVGWTADGGALYVRGTGQTPGKIYRVDLSTGKRQLWKETGVPDRSAQLVMTPDGKSYAYSYVNRSSDLYLVEGLK